MKLDSLIETVFSDKPTVDREAGVIRGVKILGKASKNQGGTREYSEGAMQDAARMYEGLGVNVNHPEDRTSNIDRPVQDGFGWLEAVRVEPDGVYGDLHYLKSHSQAAVITEAAERRPNRFGLSHNGFGKVVRQGDKNIVESIATMKSVDIVQTPATVTGLFEDVNPEPVEEKKTMLKLKEYVGRIDKDHASKPLLTALIEDDTMAGYADTPMEAAPSEMSADEQVKTAFKAMVMAVLDDESLDVPSQAARIKEILVAQDKLLSGDDPAPEEIPPTDDPNAMQESLRKQREAHSTELLEAAGIKADTVKVKALSALTESAERKALVESWKPAPDEKKTVKKPLYSAPLQESDNGEYPKDNKTFLRRMRR